MEPIAHNGRLESVRDVLRNTHAPVHTLKALKRCGELRDISQAAMRPRPKRKVLVKR